MSLRMSASYGAVWTNAFYAVVGIFALSQAVLWGLLLFVALSLLSVGSSLFHLSEFEENRPYSHAKMDEAGMYLVLSTMFFVVLSTLLPTIPSVYFVVACLASWVATSLSLEAMSSHLFVPLFAVLNIGVLLFVSIPEAVVALCLMSVAYIARYFGESNRNLHPYFHGIWHFITAYVIFRVIDLAI